ncbi:Multidrug resistance protein MdtK [compost metagenome]
MLMVAAWFELFDGMQTIAMGSIRGLKDAKTTFLIGLVCYWLVGAPSAWLFTFTLGGGAVGIWWGLALGLACAAVALTFGFEWRMKRLLGKAWAAGKATASA